MQTRSIGRFPAEHVPPSDPLVVAFEAASIDPASFQHREHLYVAWCYLRALPLEEALARYVRHLRRLTRALGAPEKFHATVTWAYVLLVHDVMQRSPDASFDALLEENPGLLDHRAGALYEVYDRAELETDRARRHFVLPGRRRSRLVGSRVASASRGAPCFTTIALGCSSPPVVLPRGIACTMMRTAVASSRSAAIARLG